MRARPTLAALLLLLLLVGPMGLAPSAAEDSSSAEEMAAQSLALRTALHQDPTLSSPLTRLLELYRQTDRVADLLALYATHLQQYPEDLPARVVYVRLLLESNDPEAVRLLRAASGQHPTHGYLHYLVYEQLDDEDDPRALDELAEAIANEPLLRRKRRWVELLLVQALAQDRRKLATDHLPMLAQVLGGSAKAHLAAARRMHAFDLHARALEELEAATAAHPTPETGVEIDLLAATLAVALQRRAQAAERLDALLERLTPDYWRRAEILRRRARLVSSTAERDAMLAAARQRMTNRPGDEGAVLDLARLLRGFERPREAIAALRAGGARLPASARIEQERLAILQRLRDEPGRAAFLAERLAAQPDRQDLRELWIKSLFLLGREEQAVQILDDLLAKLPLRLHLSRLLEVARFLRARGLAESATSLYKRVVMLHPNRLDVRRELAESLLATGQGAAARQVLAESISPEVSSDLFLDLLQLLVQQRLHLEARVLLDARRLSHPDDLDVRLLSIRVGTALGHTSSTAHELRQARPLADTPARYRRWLEAGVAFHSFQDGETVFLDTEQECIAKEGAQAKQPLERLEAFLDVSVAADRVDPLIPLLQGFVQNTRPAPEQLRLRRRLATLLGDRAQDELRSLMREDPERRDAYRARLALLHRDAQRWDLAQPLLRQLEVRKLHDAALLIRVLEAQIDFADGPQVLAVLRRLTEVEPTDRGHWEKWITVLTHTGEERTLRQTLRHLLRGIPQMALARTTQVALRAHLSDSYWRSILQHVARQSEADRLEALALLDEVERLSAADAVPLWIAWTRAFLQNELGHVAAREEAIGELERLSQVAPDALRIHFPDGLGVSWKAAQALLRRPVDPTAGKDEGAPLEPRTERDRSGPQRANHVRWVFDLEAGAEVSAIQPLAGLRLLVTDTQGNVFGLDRRTGKVLWHHLRRWFPQGRHVPAARRGPAQTPATRPVLDPEGAFYLPGRGRFTRYHADGRLQWQARMDSPQAPASPLVLVASPGRVYAYEAGTGEVACFSADAGRLLWLRRLDLPALSAPTPRGDGIALQDGRLLVYGPRTAILDSTDGAVLWTFEPGRVRAVPLILEDAHEDLSGLFGRRRRRTQKPPTSAGAASNVSTARPSTARPTAALPHPAPGWFSSGGFGRYVIGPGSRIIVGGRPPTPLVTYLPATRRTAAAAAARAPTSRTAIVTAAACWAGPLPAGASRFGLLSGRHLILSQTDPSRNGHALLLDLDLPMFARTIPIAGTYVGRTSRRLGLLTPGRLLLLQPDREHHPTIPVSLLAKPSAERTARPPEGTNARAPALAVLDGSCAYLTGPQGTACVNLATLAELFRTPWPAACLPPPPGTAPVAQASAMAATVSAVVADGALFTLAAPNRLVALDDLLPPMPAPAAGGDARAR